MPGQHGLLPNEAGVPEAYSQEPVSDQDLECFDQFDTTTRFQVQVELVIYWSGPCFDRTLLMKS